MLRQIQQINNKIKSNKYYFFGFLIVVGYNYYSLYNYLLNKNYNILLFYFIYFSLLYNYLSIFSYVIVFITLTIFKLLSIDNYFKNIYIIENHESISVRDYRLQMQQQNRQNRKRQQNRPRSAIYQSSPVEEESLESRVQASAERRGREEEDNARATTPSGPPDPAYNYIVAHMPECGKEMLSLNSLPQLAEYTQHM
jgi:hypothetical protein